MIKKQYMIEMLSDWYMSIYNYLVFYVEMFTYH